MSLDAFELITAFEAEFGLSVTPADAARLTTPRRVTEYVWGRITHERLTKEQLAELVRWVIVERTRIEDFTDDSHFVRDMGLH